MIRISMTTTELTPSLTAATTPDYVPAPQGPALSRATHLWQLDVLRAAAILMVFGYHLYGVVYHNFFQIFQNNWLTPPDPSPLARALSPLLFGDTGVVLFFVLSGFCIHHSILQAAKKHPHTRFGFPAFIWRRAWRIYPAYLVAIPLCLAWGYWGIELHKITLSDLACHLLLIHNLRPNYLHTINGSFWSLGVEWQFYLIYPVFLLIRRFGGIWSAVGFSLLATLAMRFWLHLTGRDDGELSHTIMWVNFPLVSWFNWCLGALIAEYWNRGRRLIPIPAWSLLPLGGLLLFASFYQPFHDIEYSHPVWALFYAALLETYLHQQRPPTLLEKALLPIGLCSYSFYLLHQPLIEAIRWFFAGTSPLFQFTLGTAIILVPTLFIAWWSYRLIETPFARWGGNLYKRLVKSPA